MIHRAMRLPMCALVLLLGACATSAPLHYYTLITPDAEASEGPITPDAEASGGLITPDASASAPQGGDASSAQAGVRADPAVTADAMSFELLPISLPAQVDQPQLVVRDGAQGMLLLNGERWIAPLGDELRSALAADLVRALPARDASGLPGNSQPRLRIKVDVRRFDSQPGSYALLGATWNVRVVNGAQAGALTCASSVRETVGPGYAALVQGHQRAIASMATQIAQVGRTLAAGQVARCPAT